MARVESLNRKLRRLIISIIVISVTLIFLLQILLNVLEFSSFGKFLYSDFWKQPHYLFIILSVCINIAVPLIIIFVLTRFFYSKYIANSTNHLNVVIQNLKNNDIDCKEHQTNITEFNHIIHEVENIHNYLSDSIKDQLTIQNNFKKKLKIFEHDLKTPLTVLQGHVELLKKMNNSNLFTEEITSKINKETDIALNSISRINKQLQIHINDINLLPNHTDTISVAKVISMISESYNHPYILKNKTLDIEIDKHFPYHQIFINNQVLYHVIDNLINNALKYANNQIILKFEMVNAHLLNFVVLNDGKTFSEEELHSAKEWGVKGRESNGSGIGLYFANEVIKQYNSEIHLNNVNQHAQVSFTIAV